MVARERIEEKRRKVREYTVVLKLSLPIFGIHDIIK
jgi:hypothetical protein